MLSTFLMLFLVAQMIGPWQVPSRSGGVWAVVKWGALPEYCSTEFKYREATFTQAQGHHDRR